MRTERYLYNLSLFLLLFFKGIIIVFTPQQFDYLFENAHLAQVIIGSILIVSSFVPLIPCKFVVKFKLYYFYFFSFLGLLIHTLTTYITAKYAIEQIIEHSLQLFLPIIIFYQFLKEKNESIKHLLTIKVLVALTFIGHGVFAIGLHYVPDNFIQMSSRILEFNQQQSLNFLYFVGILDILFSITLFIPFFQKISLYYMILWGTITSIARCWYGLSIQAPIQEIFLNFLPNSLYRMLHGIVPLIILFHINRKGNNFRKHSKFKGYGMRNLLKTEKSNINKTNNYPEEEVSYY